jgi:hypothetical protein
VRVRFVTCSDIVSSLIRDCEGPMAPWVKFTPSHVELAGFALPDGTPGYLGAHDQGGVMIRPVGYDKATLTGELLVDVPLPDEAAAIAFARSKIGTPYDFGAILGFLVFKDLHQDKHAICSAYVTAVLTVGKLFTGALAREPSQIDPADLLFLLSGRFAIGTT